MEFVSSTRRGLSEYQACCHFSSSPEVFQPVSYSSRALTASEKNYSQIEKDLLSQVFRVERNHHFVYGTESCSVV